MATINGTGDDDGLTGTGGNDSISGGNGNDVIRGEGGNDSLYGGNGEDTLYGGAGDDIIYGGNGDDVIELGASQNFGHAYGDGGNDTFIGSGGQNEHMYGGSGDDLFIIKAPAAPTSIPSWQTWYENTNFHVWGGQGGYDRLTYQDLLNNGFTIEPGQTLNGKYPDYSGSIKFVNHETKQYVTLNFHEIAEFVTLPEVVPCFTPGTLVITPLGERCVEDLRAGDRVVTRDSGIQEILWTGRRELSRAELLACPEFCPVLICKGALGEGLPERDLLVSPNHRVLITHPRAELLFDEREVLVAAKHLVNGDTIRRVEGVGVTYIHFMCEAHEIVLSNGAWTESFQPGDMALKALTHAQRNELLTLFPELSSEGGSPAFGAARRVLRRHEALLL